jgi:hypothetical protein
VKPGLYSLRNFKKDDRTQMSNLDRFMESTIPAGIDVNKHGVAQIAKALHKPSIFGLNL